MTALSRVRILRMGLHSSASDFSSTPGTLVFPEPMAGILDKTSQVKIERELTRGDGEPYSRTIGAKNLDALSDMTLRLKGLGAGGAGAAEEADRLAEAQVIARILDAVLGAGANGTGATSADPAGTGTTLNLTSGTAQVAGRGLLVKGATSGAYVAREIVSKSTDAMTLDRGLTTPAGAAENPAVDEVVYASATWYAQPKLADHTHLYFDIEGDQADSRRQLFGVMPGGVSFAFPNGGKAEVSLTGLRCTDWAAGAKASPTFAPPTEGNEITCISSPIWLGADQYDLINASLDLGLTVAPRETQTGPQGVAGYAVIDVRPRLTGSIRLGALAGEAAQALLQAMQAGNTYDVGVQFGRNPGACVYMRWPAGNFDAELVDLGGQEAIQFTLHPSRSANHANVPGAFRIHFF
jgi:hypothetical protein